MFYPKSSLHYRAREGTLHAFFQVVLFDWLTVEVVKSLQYLGRWNHEIVTENLDKQKAKAGGTRSASVQQQSVDFIVPNL